MKEWLKSKENIKTKRNIIISIILIFSLWYYENYILVDNVFDYMYYSRAGQRLFINENEIETMEYNYHEPENFVQSTFSFFKNEISESQNVLSEYHLLSDGYKHQRLYMFVDSRYWDIYDEPTDFEFKSEAAIMDIYYELSFEATSNPQLYDNIEFRYTYVPHTNTLYPELCIKTRDEPKVYSDELCTYEEGEELLAQRGITSEDLEEIHQWLLYDRVLKDFFTYNENKTRFSIENLGDFEIAELNTYDKDGYVSRIKDDSWWWKII